MADAGGLDPEPPGRRTEAPPARGRCDPLDRAWSRRSRTPRSDRAHRCGGLAAHRVRVAAGAQRRRHGAHQTARIWDVLTGESLKRSLEHHESVASAAFSPDGTRIVTASWDGTARVWNAATGKPLTRPLVHYSRLERAAFSPDG